MEITRRSLAFTPRSMISIFFHHFFLLVYERGASNKKELFLLNRSKMIDKHMHSEHMQHTLMSFNSAHNLPEKNPNLFEVEEMLQKIRENYEKDVKFRVQTG